MPCCTVVYDSSYNVAARCHRANKKASLPNYLLCFYALVQSWPSFSCARLPFGMRRHPRVAGKSRRALGRQVVIYPGPWAQAPSSQCFRVLTSRNVAQGGPDAPSFNACLCPVQGAIGHPLRPAVHVPWDRQFRQVRSEFSALLVAFVKPTAIVCVAALLCKTDRATFLV